MLVDIGFTGDTLNNNLDLLGIDLAKLDAMLLSHDHYDRFDDMVGFLVAHGNNAQTRTAVLPRRRGVLLPPRDLCDQHAVQLVLAEPQGDRGRGTARAAQFDGDVVYLRGGGMRVASL